MCQACLQDARDAIDRLDEHLAGLLLERLRRAAGIVARRLDGGGPPRDPERERAVVEHVLGAARSVAERSALRRIYQLIFDHAALEGCRPAAEIQAPGGAVSRVVTAGSARFGDGSLALIAGPCAVEDERQIMEAAAAAREAGAVMLRGGAWKPRSSPAAFQGLGAAGLSLLRRAAEAEGLALVTEVLDPADAPRVAEVADLLQVGSRSMHCTPLLRAVGRAGRPALLKRGMAATVAEMIQASEYLREAGCEDVVLCLRGIRSFSDASRFTLDLAAGPLLRRRTGLPVVVDPSHAAGCAELVPPLALAAAAAGADGLMIEVHPDPPAALCDAHQALHPRALFDLMRQVRALRAAQDETVRAPSACGA